MAYACLDSVDRCSSEQFHGACRASRLSSHTWGYLLPRPGSSRVVVDVKVTREETVVMSDEISETVECPGSRTPLKFMSWLGRTLWASRRVAEARNTNFGTGQPGFVSFAMAFDAPTPVGT